jgi:hypothetical protein
VKRETINHISKQRLVSIFGSDGVPTKTGTYDAKGQLAATTTNDPKNEKGTTSTMRTKDGSITTTKRFPDDSVNERTVRPDCATVVHFHSPSSTALPAVALLEMRFHRGAQSLIDVALNVVRSLPPTCSQFTTMACSPLRNATVCSKLHRAQEPISPGA